MNSTNGKDKKKIKINWKLLTVVIALVCSLLYSLYCPSKWSTCLRFLLVSLNKKGLGKKSKQKLPLIQHYCCLYSYWLLRLNWKQKCFFLNGLSIQNPIQVTRIWRDTAWLKGGKWRRRKKKKDQQNL